MKPKQFNFKTKTTSFKSSVEVIKTEGLMNPVIVKINTGENSEEFLYILVDGKRRFLAALIAGLKIIPIRLRR